MSVKPAAEQPFMKGKLNPYSEEHQKDKDKLSQLAAKGPQTSSREVPDDKESLHDLFNKSFANLAGAPKADSAPPNPRVFQQLNGGSSLCGPDAPKVKENMPRPSINVPPTPRGLPGGNLTLMESLTKAQTELPTPKGHFTHPVSPVPESPSLKKSPEDRYVGALREGTPKHAGERDSLRQLAARMPTPRAPTSLSEGLNQALEAIHNSQHLPPAPESPSSRESPEDRYVGALREGTPKHGGERDGLRQLAARMPTPRAPTSLSEGLNQALEAIQKSQHQG